MRHLALSLPLLGLAAPGGLLAARAQTSVSRGKMIFLHRTACHAMSATVPGKVGLHMHSVVERTSGTVARFTYSPAMRTANLHWDQATLDRWLTRPATFVRGTSMDFTGLANDRRAVIVYLKKQVH